MDRGPQFEWDRKGGRKSKTARLSSESTLRFAIERERDGSFSTDGLPDNNVNELRTQSTGERDVRDDQIDVCESFAGCAITPAVPRTEDSVVGATENVLTETDRNRDTSTSDGKPVIMIKESDIKSIFEIKELKKMAARKSVEINIQGVDKEPSKNAVGESTKDPPQKQKSSDSPSAVRKFFRGIIFLHIPSRSLLIYLSYLV